MLTTRAIQDASLDRAIGEVLTNAERACVAGFAPEAFQALTTLLAGGAWRLPAHGAIVYRLQRLLPDVALLADEAAPAVGAQAAISRAQQPDWCLREAAARLRTIAMVGRRQLRPAGADWTSGFLSTLSQHGQDFGPFCDDAEFVLKARVARRFGCDTGAIDPRQLTELAALGVPADALAGLSMTADAIRIAPAAETTGTLAIARALARYLREAGGSGGYLADFIWQACWLLLADAGQAADAEEVAGAWLAHNPDAGSQMLGLAVVPAIRAFLRTGVLAGAAQVDASAVRGWLAAMATRRAPECGAPANDPVWSPAQSQADLLGSLDGTSLRGLRWHRVPVPGNGEHAWVARVLPEDSKTLWHEARGLVERTGRWPLVTTSWSGAAGDADAQGLGAELFARSPYGAGASRDDLSPRSFIASSRSVDLQDMLDELAGQEYRPGESEQLQAWRDELAAVGASLAGFDQAWAACQGDPLRFERWLAGQEAAQGLADAERGRQPGFEPDNAWLLLLPTPNGEEALAYVHWFGLERGPADGFIALLRRWRERHGAELCAHYGTMLEFVVRRPPRDVDEALPLAREHLLAAPCTLLLPGIALRHHALGLVGHAEWFLHERP